jgi:hypothetical protein
MGVLVNERCQELSRVTELTGSLTNYNMLASALPQETRVFYTFQVHSEKMTKVIIQWFTAGGCTRGIRHRSVRSLA